MTKQELRNNVFQFLASFDSKIRTKFSNICGKTGQYNVPDELFQKRTHRKNRVLISWKTVKNNNLTLEQLETFSGGVVIEFVNNDYFNKENEKDELFQLLKKRLGSDENVSSMISIRTEDGSSSSNTPRKSFTDLKRLFPAYKHSIIQRKQKKKENSKNSGIGNDTWKGFIYISIKGGEQDTIETHTRNVKYQLFNPACEFANESVCLDIDLVMSYFALKSINLQKLDIQKKSRLENLKKETEIHLKNSKYNNDTYKGNLLDYCREHPAIKMKSGKLIDPIQVEEIEILDFAIDNKEDSRNLDFTHDEAVNNDKYYYDIEQNCILTATRPTNIFWSKHLSNMMQQNFSLKEYFIREEERVKRRKELLTH